MKTMLISELLAWKESCMRSVLIYLALGVFVGIICENPWTASSMVTAMAIIAAIMTGPALDEKNDWMVGRLCLPISRKDVVVGRYAAWGVFAVFAIVMAVVATALTVIVAQVAFPANDINRIIAGGDIVETAALSILTACALVSLSAVVYYPLTFKYGMGKAIRLVPAVLVLVVMFAFIGLGTVDGISSLLPNLDELFASSMIPLMVICLVGTLAMMAISCFVSIKFYEAREL